MKKNNPRFIVFEGIDGAGKSTQIDLFEKALIARGTPVFRTAEPTSSETGRRLRRALAGDAACSPEELAILFTLDRAEHNRAIGEALDRGETVLCDRYYYSTMAYQGFATNLDWVMHMNLDCPAIRTPDLCVFLDLLPDESLSRIASRGGKTEIYETKAQLETIRNAFFSLFQTLPNIAVIDASGSIDEVHREILKKAL